MTLVNFAAALAVPRLMRRIPGATLLAVGMALTLVGMAWLSRVDAGDTYLAAVALPMLLIGAGQGLAFAPLTNSGIAGVAPENAGAASGLVNTAHQLGMALGLGILVVVSANAGTGSSGVVAQTAAHVSAALTGATVLVALALVVVLAVVLPAGDRPPQPTDRRHTS